MSRALNTASEIYVINMQSAIHSFYGWAKGRHQELNGIGQFSRMADEIYQFCSAIVCPQHHACNARHLAVIHLVFILREAILPDLSR